MTKTKETKEFKCGLSKIRKVGNGKCVTIPKVLVDLGYLNDKSIYEVVLREVKPLFLSMVGVLHTISPFRDISENGKMYCM